MCNFLVIKQAHWMDRPSKSEPSKTGYQRRYDLIENDESLSRKSKNDKRAELLAEYNFRVQPMDIIEVRPDDQGMSGLEPDSFYLIRVPGLTVEQGKALIEWGAQSRATQYKTQFDYTGFVFDENGEATLDIATYNGRFTVKNG